MRSVHPRPLVTLILPTCDRRALFRRSLESALHQTYENLEVVVVNDGGVPVDDIVAELDRFARVVQLRLPVRRGPAVARNHALRLARGEFLGFLDDDDTLDPHHVATLVGALRGSAHRIAYALARRRIEEEHDGDLVIRHEEPTWPAEAPPITTDVLLYQNPLPIQAALVHRSCLEESGGFDDSLPILEDWELWLRLSRYDRFLRVEATTSTTSARADGLARTRLGERFTSAGRVIALHTDLAAGRPHILAEQTRLLDGLARRSASETPTCALVVPFRSEGAGHVRGFLAQLRRSVRGVAVETIAIDRGLAPAAAAELVAAGFQVVKRPSSEPLGHALDAAIAFARSPHVALVRCDVLLEDGWLHALLDRGDSDTIVGGKTLESDGRIAHAGFAFRRDDGTARALFRGVEASATELLTVDAIEATAAASVLVPTKLATRLGMGEIDGWSAIADFCLRARAEGSITVLAPGSVAYRVPQRAATPWVHDAELATLAEAARRVLGTASEGSSPPTHAIRSKLAAATAHADRGDIAVAWLALRELAERHGDDPEVIHALYCAGLAAAEWEALAGVLERYIAARPEDHEKRYALVSVSLRAGLTGLARSHFEELCHRAPSMVGLDSLRRRIQRAA